MEPGASNVIAQGFLKGAFDVFDALLGKDFNHDTIDIEDLTVQALEASLAEYPVYLRAHVKTGGAFAVLISMPDARQLLTMVLGESPADPLDDTAVATLQETAEPFLGGGVSNLSEKFGQAIELTPSEAGIAEPGQAGSLLDYVGPQATQVGFRFSAPPEFNGAGVLLFSQTVEQAVPKELLNLVFGEDESSAVTGEASLSGQEMNDILRGFDAPAHEAPSPSLKGEQAMETHETPGNLDMVLDIRLRVTARLGRVEMPIREILALGPGSIVEVGHTVEEPVELLVNDKLIARGDVVVVDEKFGLRITEIVSAKERIESLR